MADEKDIKESLDKINTQYGETLKRLSESEKQERNEKLWKALNELGEIIREEQAEYEKTTNEWWDNLSYDDRLRAFYSVCKRIHQGDIKDRGSYRHVLYQVFGFGPDAYMVGMDCGYLDIHNSIVLPDEERKD
jgi:DNA phosphorothioation-dependent restriction protein DptG